VAGSALSEPPEAVRRRVLQWRADLAPSEAAARSAQITAHLIAWAPFRAAQHLLIYLAMPREVQTAGLIAAASGKRVCVPSVVGRHLVLRPLVAGRPLRRGAMGIAEPKAAAGEVPPTEVDLALVPGVAFDPAGHRVGHGAGFYDRFLPTLRPSTPVCGLAFREQVVPALEPAPWDVPVGFLCTEDGVVACSPA